MTTTRTGLRPGLRRGFYVLPAKPTAPTAPVTGCADCDHGCSCEMGTPGCAHFGCWGTRVDDVADTCAAVAAHIDHSLAWAVYQRELHDYQQSSHRR